MEPPASMELEQEKYGILSSYLANATGVVTSYLESTIPRVGSNGMQLGPTAMETDERKYKIVNSYLETTERILAGNLQTPTEFEPHQQADLMESPASMDIKQGKYGILTSCLDNTGGLVTSYLKSTIPRASPMAMKTDEHKYNIVNNYLKTTERVLAGHLETRTLPEHQQQVVKVLIRKLATEGGEVDQKEMELALRSLEVCCRSNEESNEIVHQLQAVEVLVRILAGEKPYFVQLACLDALDAVLANSRENQMVFLECNGIDTVTTLIRDQNYPLKWKCGEFLLRFVRHVNGIPSPAITPENIRRVLSDPWFDWPNPRGPNLDWEEGKEECMRCAERDHVNRIESSTFANWLSTLKGRGGD